MILNLSSLLENNEEPHDFMCAVYGPDSLVTLTDGNTCYMGDMNDTKIIAGSILSFYDSALNHYVVHD